MKAFLKRRWVLLSFAIGLLACTMVDLERVSYSKFSGENTYYKEGGGLSQGYFRSFEGAVISEANPDPGWRFATHRPQFGDLPERSRTTWTTTTQVPIWLLLAAILGWVVFGELRWREKREKAVDANPAQP